MEDSRYFNGGGPKRCPSKRFRFVVLASASLLWSLLLIFSVHDALRFDVNTHLLTSNVDFIGGDIGSMYNIRSAERCRAICEWRKKCRAFTYIKSTSECWLKGKGFEARRNIDAISGIVHKNESASNTKPPKRGQNESARSFTPYPDFWDGDDTSTDPGFNGSDWDDVDAVEAELQVSSSATRDVVKPTNLEVELFEDSTNFFGDMQILTEVFTVDSCFESCKETRQCVAWTLDKYRYICLLRLSLSPTVRYSEDYIGARLSAKDVKQRAVRLAAPEDEEWPLPAELSSDDVAENTNFTGEALATVHHIDNLLGCRGMCRKHSSCFAVTLNKRTNICLLKTNNYSASSVPRSAGLVSSVVVGAPMHLGRERVS